MRSAHIACLAVAATAVALTAGAVIDPARARPAAVGGSWVGSWEAAPAGTDPAHPLGLSGYTVRNLVHLSVGGNSVRIRLSNAYGSTPMRVGDATVAVAVAPNRAEAQTGTMRPLTFGGSRAPTIPIGEEVVSDPVALPVRSGATLLISAYTPDPGPITYHPDAQQRSYLTPAGDHTGDLSGLAFGQTVGRWYLVYGVDVRMPHAKGVVVAFGDSITDGYRSRTGANRRWPDDLARRLVPQGYGVLNAGISGNRLLLGAGGPNGPGTGPSALSRFERDVLSRPRVRAVVVLEGINDIGLFPEQTDPRRIEAALRNIATQAHRHGVRVMVATLLPFGRSVYDRPGLEAVRTAVNKWIRTTHAFDAVVDFDRVLRDPRAPDRMLPAYDSGDHLHPGNAGYQAMSNAIATTRLLG
jgi:lysophospholipase L1-like esterase